MTPVKRLVAACSYTKKNGEEKTNWVEMGTLWKNDAGKFRISISAVPTVNWDGWVNLQDPWESQDKPENANQEEAKQEIGEDDIPF